MQRAIDIGTIEVKRRGSDTISVKILDPSDTNWSASFDLTTQDALLVIQLLAEAIGSK